MSRLLILLLWCPLALKGQTGLNKVFNLPGMVSTTIKSIEIDNDTIVAFGGVIDVPGHYGVHVSKYDTLGNLLSFKTYFHPLGKSYYLAQAPGFIKTSDGGYLGVGDVNIGENMVVFKFSHSCDLEWASEIDDSSLRVLYGFNPSECSGGYFIPGFVQYQNYDVNGTIYKIGDAGSILWRKDYGMPGPTDLAGDIQKRDDNTFFVSGGQSTGGVGVGEPGYWSKVWVFEIDSTGAVLSDWRSEISENLGSCKIALTGDHELVLISSHLKYNPPYVAMVDLMMRKLDTNDWHTVWQSYQTSSDLYYLYGWLDLAQNPTDGAWDVVGSFQHVNNGYVIGGVSAHVNPENGERIWLREDTVYLSPILNVNENHLRSVGHLSSGSIIAGGWVLSTEGDYHQEAWLRKLSSGGCLDASDCATVAAHAPGNASTSSFLNWEVFPNPATTYTLLVPDKDLQGQSGEVAIYDLRGSLIREARFTIQPQLTVKVDLLGLSPGLYTYQVLVKGKAVGNGKILVTW